VLQDWSYSIKSPEPSRNVNYLSLNKDGVQKKYFKPKDFRQLQKENPRLQKPMNSKDQYLQHKSCSSINFNTPDWRANFKGFGKETLCNRLPVKGIMENHYGAEADVLLNMKEQKA